MYKAGSVILNHERNQKMEFLIKQHTPGQVCASDFKIMGPLGG